MATYRIQLVRYVTLVVEAEQIEAAMAKAEDDANQGTWDEASPWELENIDVLDGGTEQ